MVRCIMPKFTWLKTVCKKSLLKESFILFLFSRESGQIILLRCFFYVKEVPNTPQQANELDVLSEEQKKQLGELQLFKNKEGNVSIEVGLLLPASVYDLTENTESCMVCPDSLMYHL